MNALAIAERPMDTVKEPGLDPAIRLFVLFLLALIVLLDTLDGHGHSPGRGLGELGTAAWDPVPADASSDEDAVGGPDEDVSVFAQRLAELREAIVAPGEPLLSWEELDREIAERRGGAEQSLAV